MSKHSQRQDTHDDLYDSDEPGRILDAVNPTTDPQPSEGQAKDLNNLKTKLDRRTLDFHTKVTALYFFARRYVGKTFKNRGEVHEFLGRMRRAGVVVLAGGA